MPSPQNGPYLLILTRHPVHQPREMSCLEQQEACWHSIPTPALSPIRYPLALSNLEPIDPSHRPLMLSAPRTLRPLPIPLTLPKTNPFISRTAHTHLHHPMTHTADLNLHHTHRIYHRPHHPTDHA